MVGGSEAADEVGLYPYRDGSSGLWGFLAAGAEVAFVFCVPFKCILSFLTLTFGSQHFPHSVINMGIL